MNEDIELHIDYKFNFGRNKGFSARDILIREDGNYIIWMIHNFSDLIFSPKFLEDAVNTSPFFEIKESDYEKLHLIIRNYKLKYKGDYLGNDFESYLQDQSYMRCLKISDDDKKIIMEQYLKKCKEHFEQGLLIAKEKVNIESKIDNNSVLF